MSATTIYSLVFEKTNDAKGKDGEASITLEKRSDGSILEGLDYEKSGEFSKEKMEEVLSKFLKTSPDKVAKEHSFQKIDEEVFGEPNRYDLSLCGVVGLTEESEPYFFSPSEWTTLYQVANSMYDLESSPEEGSSYLGYSLAQLKSKGKRGDKIVTVFSEKAPGKNTFLDNLEWMPADNSPENHSLQETDKSSLSPMGETISSKLLNSKNIILHGAPGTGKTHLAWEIADHLAGGESCIEFVQFHPSYDYTDFVEGLRPVPDTTSEGKSNVPESSKDTPGSDEEKAPDIKFAPQPGIFKEFVEKAKRANEDANTKGLAAPKYVFIIDEINRGEISKIFGELFFSIDPDYRVSLEDHDKPKRTVRTQYANVNGDKEGFFIPDNVYIIGTMNDIDRSVDSFDFAMRRRFRFIEITPEDTKDDILKDVIGEPNPKADEMAKNVMGDLNEVISREDGEGVGLNRNYEVGPSYFLKLAELNNDYVELWNEYIGPLLYEYLRGAYNPSKKMKRLAKTYADKANIEKKSLWLGCKE